MVLTIHHLQISQSERVPWLCEELGIPYELKTYKRSPLLAPPEFKALHPQGSAPVITDGDLTLAESGACLEYIAHKYGGGQLFRGPSSPDYPQFLYWWHWANATLQANLVRTGTLRGAGLAEDHPARQNASGRVHKALANMDARVKESKWLAGGEFSAADVMVVFSLTTMRYFYPLDLGDYTGILEYLERVGKREAYRRTMEKIDPGMELLLGAKPAEKTLM